MKNTTRFLQSVLTLSLILLSACSNVQPPSTGDDSNANGSISTPFVDDNGNSSNSNDTNSDDANSNDTNSNGNDDNSNTAGDDPNEIFGIVEAITADSITVGGVTYQLAAITEFKDAVAVGDQVKIHIIVNADGTFTVREIEISDGLSGDDNGNDANSNDDNGNDDNSNDDNGDDDNDNNDDSGHGGGDDDGDDNGNDD
jgi:uncharacterized protein DUF5666